MAEFLNSSWGVALKRMKLVLLVKMHAIMDGILIFFFITGRELIYAARKQPYLRV